MFNLPYVVRTPPGSAPQIEEGLPVSSVDTALPTVWIRLPRQGTRSQAIYWSALATTQGFFDRPTPQTSELDLALDTFRKRAPEEVAALAAVVSLGTDGTIFVSGGGIDATRRTGASLIRLDPGHDLLSPRSDWQAHALATNSRAVVEAFRRHLRGQGANDAVVVRDDETVVPVVGALVVGVGKGLRTSSATTVIPDMLSALLGSSALAPRDGVELGQGLSRADVDSADCAWWISPEFEVWSVAELAGRLLPEARSFDDFLEFA